MLNQVMDIAIILLIAATILMLLFLVRLISGISRFVNEARTEIMPSLHKLQDTIEEVNGELAKVDLIMQSVQGVTDKVSATTKVAQEVISSPLIKIASYSFGAQKAIGRFLRKK